MNATACTSWVACPVGTPRVKPSHRRSELRPQLSLPEPDEALLVRSHLVHVDMVESGRLELAQLLDDRVGVWSARHLGGDVLLTHERHRLLEMRGRRQVLRELTRQ